MASEASTFKDTNTVLDSITKYLHIFTWLIEKPGLAAERD
jgi:hypothetical protein